MKKRAVTGTMLIVVLSLLLSAAAGAVSLYLRQVDTARQSLRELLEMTDALSEGAGAGEVSAAFRAAAPDKRLTLVAADGTVLADTQGETTEDHAGRPEIRQALESGWGEITRTSATVGYPMLYLAKRFADGTVGRAAMPLSSVDALVRESLPPLLIAAALALVMAWALARRLAAELVRPLNAVGAALREALDGHETASLEAQEVDEELRPVLRRIAQLVEQLRESLRQVRAERDKVRRAEDVRAQFTANVSHELKTPLTSIKGFSDMLAQGMVKDEADQRRFASMIGVETDRLIALINDVLEISELDSAAIDAPQETASPLAAARQVAELLTPAAEQRGARIEVSGADGEARLPADRLKEVLMNLVDNALKYGKEQGGTVEVTVTREGEEMVLCVSDDGIGIPEEAQGHVFERFYRVDKGRSRRSGGTGLGLAIVKHICQLYGGSVEVRSALGEGSTFTVRLPAA